MTLDEFLEELAQHKGEFELINGKIRHKTLLDRGEVGVPSCPLNAACAWRDTKAYRSNQLVGFMAAELDMPLYLALEIVNAVDYENTVHPKLRTVRTELLKATGIIE